MLPIIDLDTYLAAPNSVEGQGEAARIMEEYFAQPEEALAQDTRPQYHYQVGTTLENTEKPKCHSDAACKAVIASLDPAERPLDLEGGKADPKCRFFHRMGVPPPTTSFPTLAMANVTPAAFPHWVTSMEEWGVQIKSAVEGVASLLGDGLGVGDSLRQAGQYGPHLLAPTATDLSKYGRVNEIFAGFHTDLNFLSIHGRSRYPGLHIWARNTGKRISVKLPPGHLLVQAGKQLEYLTNGLILAGYHEVVCTPATIAAMASPANANRLPIRISSTFFWHLSSDYSMDPERFSKAIKTTLLPEPANSFPPPMLVGDHVQEELKHIALLA